MILNQLTLNNFCIYRGEHTFDLAPGAYRGRPQPVVLFGGINGGGKTTILDAVQLVLYGKRAKCSKRGDKGYEEFLRGCINHDIAPDEGASITLTFLYASEGHENVYEVTRAWSATAGNAIRERITVLKDGDRDGWMSENWNQLVEDLIPYGIAQLCFFDAEKIRFLAEDESSSRALGEAIKSLLGLDLAERLVADTTVLENRIAKRIQKSDELEALAELESLREEKYAEIQRLKQDLAGLVPLHERAGERIRRAESNFGKVGGKHWEQREQRQRQHGELKSKVQLSEESLVSIAAGALPLALLGDVLGEVRDQAEAERSSTESDFISSLLERRDQSLLKQLKLAQAAEEVLGAAEEFLQEDRLSRAKGEVDSWLDLPDVSARRLEELLQNGMTDKLEQASDVLEQLDAARRELETVQRSLAAAPKEDAIKEIAQELKAATSEVANLQTQLNKVERELASVTSERDELDKKISSLSRRHIDEKIATHEHARVGALVARTQETMKKFLRRATAKKIQHLSELVTTSFRFLLHKKSLIEQVIIDPESFSISLIDKDGKVLPKDQLSEGEKQIFAISVLWGLSQASARPLPAIIDTPMGRLDVEHRNQLVQRYFPHASHQVIILSTDTEIEVDYFEQLKPSIARAYHLRYNEDERTTQAEEGYFWDVDAREEVTV